MEIEFELSRQRALGWTIFGGVVGALLLWKFGTVGRWVGVVLILVGAYRAWQLIQTFMYPAGTIAVSDREVVLPRGLCMSKPVHAAPSDVTAVYFLRRSVPWNRASPVLVVELGDRALAYPRDWFASEADQRHAVHALLRGIRDPEGKARAKANAEAAKADVARADVAKPDAPKPDAKLDDVKPDKTARDG